jgi:5-methylcytosine-specific restriction endonuclease McrA
MDETRREAERKRLAEYAAKNPEKVRAAKRAWSQANPDAVKSKTRNRRARKKAIGGTHTAEDIQDIHRLQKGKCAICRKKLGEKYDVDHVVPIAKGGSNARSNLQLTHPLCNQRKNRKDPLDHMRSLGFLL